MLCTVGSLWPSNAVHCQLALTSQCCLPIVYDLYNSILQLPSDEEVKLQSTYWFSYITVGSGSGSNVYEMQCGSVYYNQTVPALITFHGVGFVLQVTFIIQHSCTIICCGLLVMAEDGSLWMFSVREYLGDCGNVTQWSHELEWWPLCAPTQSKLQDERSRNRKEYDHSGFHMRRENENGEGDSQTDRQTNTK